MAFGQAGMIQSQLNFTRANEREADRVGLQILDGAGLDPRGMAVFFERLQRATRIYDWGAPAYLQTHPLTFERIADVQGRIEAMPYRQVPDSIEFQLVRAKIKASFDAPGEAVAYFEESLKERKFLSEAASRYGLTLSRMRAANYAAAKKELAGLQQVVPNHPMVENLACNLLIAAGEQAQGLKCFSAALQRYSGHRAMLYDYVSGLLQAGQPGAALKLIESRLQLTPEDYRLYQLQARSHAMLNRRLAQHRAQAEAYARLGNLPAAVEQLQIAVKSGDGDFYQLSSAEARLRELRRVVDQERREAAKR